MRIYWIEDGRRRGPISVPDAIAKLQLGELQPDMQAWHSGCESWVPLRELPALSDYFASPQPASPAAEEPATPLPPNLPPLPPPVATTVLRVMLPRPWVRFLARMVDTALYATFVLGIAYLFQVPYNTWIFPGSIFFWIPMVLLEACMLYTWGSTPGKSWLGIRVRPLNGRLSFAAALKRSVLVYVLGMGCMFSFLMLVMLILSYFGVVRRGVALWDIHTGTAPVVTRQPSVLKRFFVVVYLFFCLKLCGLYTKPWMPDIVEEIRENDPKTARLIEEFMSMDR